VKDDKNDFTFQLAIKLRQFDMIPVEFFMTYYKWRYRNILNFNYIIVRSIARLLIELLREVINEGWMHIERMGSEVDE